LGNLKLRIQEPTSSGSDPESFQCEAGDLRKAGWSLGWVSAIDSDVRTIWIVEAHRDDGKRFVVLPG